MKPTITVAEVLTVYRKYDIPMSQPKLEEMLQAGLFTFAEAWKKATWTYTIWRLGFYRYLASRGVPVTELAEYVAEIKGKGWDEAWEKTV